ncbi:uncharacterized protein [Diabrotica undecimpunctata]|uniref:uncharacterized protein n=1 Tax=Diabrotica undecimpunctata TaxID=50387 RepID=UPI003B632610
MRALCGTWWGSDPKILKLIHEALILSHLNYGGQFLSTCPKYILKKLDQMHYQSIRIITGCMKSTPIQALLSESGELPLKYRREWLTTKFLLKNLSIKNNPVIQSIIELEALCNMDNKYWRNKEKPILIATIRKIQPYLQNLYSSKLLPCHEYDLELQLQPLGILNENITKNEFNLMNFVNLVKKFHSYKKFFTDGSTDTIGNAGFGVFSPDINYSFSSKLPNHTQICTAEVTAINHAVQIIREQNITEAIIFSDSKSALQKIKKTGFSKDTEHISYLTKTGIILARNNNIKILLAWIPGHTGITGNYKADQLANIGRSLNIPMNIKLEFSNFTPYLKREIWSNWAAEWYEGYGTISTNKYII